MTRNRTAAIAAAVGVAALAALAATSTAGTASAARRSQAPSPGVVAGAPFGFDGPGVDPGARRSQ